MVGGRLRKQSHELWPGHHFLEGSKHQIRRTFVLNSDIAALAASSNAFRAWSRNREFVGEFRADTSLNRRQLTRIWHKTCSSEVLWVDSGTTISLSWSGRRQVLSCFQLRLLSFSPRLFDFPASCAICSSMVLLPRLAANFLKPLVPTSLGYSFISIAYRPFSISRLLQQIDMETVDTSKRLAQLRSLMKENKVDIYSMCKENHLTWQTI